MFWSHCVVVVKLLIRAACHSRDAPLVRKSARTQLDIVKECIDVVFHAVRFAENAATEPAPARGQ